jgi:hypothetical protein
MPRMWAVNGIQDLCARARRTESASRNAPILRFANALITLYSRAC